MKHWIRDLQLPYSSYSNARDQIDYVVFHFLRTAGWEWIWECDGVDAGTDPNTNHIPDGNMEAAGIADWTPVNTANVSKITTPVFSGTQALEVDSQAVGDGVESAVFLNMEDSLEYQIAIRARNNTGQPWTVQIDDGSGSFVSIGSIPHSGTSFATTHLSFTSAASGNRKLRILDGAGTLGVLYVSDILVFKSYFEYNPTDSIEQGTDGVITNPDQFSSPSYTFVSGDVGKIVCVWDPDNPGNSGAYAIASVAAGVATLDLRSGSATLTSETNLSWRMIDRTKAPENTGNTDPGEKWCGFGLQSPHASGWRFFLRQAQYANASGWITAAAVWGAPGDTDFDFSTGNFYPSGPSTQLSKQSPYSTPAYNATTWSGQHALSGRTNRSTGTKRLFLMTDDDGSFFSIIDWSNDDSYHDVALFGYLGYDVGHPGIEEWGFFCRWESVAPVTTSLWFDNGVDRAFYNGTVCSRQGQTVRALWAQYGYGTSTGDVVTMSNAGPNRWSGDEWLHKPIIMRDPDGTVGQASERDADVGVYQGRQNMLTLSGFDSDSYVHFRAGLAWEWSGASLLP